MPAVDTILRIVTDEEMSSFWKSLFALVAALVTIASGAHLFEYRVSVLEFALATTMIGLVAWTASKYVQRRRRRKLDEMRDSALW